MKRTSFSALVTALSFLVASGSAVSAQQFPSTGHSGFNSVVQTSGYLTTNQLSPMSVSQDPGLAIAPGALPQGSGTRLLAPQQIQVLPQAQSLPPVQIAPQGSGTRLVAPQAQTLSPVQVLPQTQAAPQFQSTAQQAFTLPPATGPQNSISSQNPIQIAPTPPPNYTPPQYRPGPSGTLGPASQSPATNGGPYTSAMQSAPVIQSAPVFQSESAPVFQSVVQNPVVQGGQTPQTYLINEPQPVEGDSNGLRRSLIGRRPPGSVYSTIGASGLLFNRNVGGNRNFSTNNNGNLLASNNTDDTVLGGIDAFVARRKANGNGWEARYFGLYPNDESIQVGNNASHLIPGFDQIGTSLSGTGPAAFLTGPSAGNLFNLADTHVLTRQTELNNIEFNILRRAFPRFRARSTEFLLGFRYFQFGETLLHEAVGITGGDPMFATPNSIGYFSSVENNLLGLQVGSRSDFRLRRRLLMHLSIKAGAFNNRVNARQRVDYRLPNGSIINPSVAGGTLAGERFDIGAQDDVKSILAELDIAFSFQLSASSRIRAGYRALGVTDIAFSSDQIQDDFTDALGLGNPNTDGTLIAQGAYVGLEFAF